MPPYGEPDWATPGDTTNAATTVLPGTSNPVSAAAGSNGNSGETRYVQISDQCCLCVE